MKPLVVSLKTPGQALDAFEKALKNARLGKLGHGFFISFDSKKDFGRFIRNIDVLMCIINNRPRSVYELSKLVHKDVSNLNKLITFFNSIGALEIKRIIVKGRAVNTPVVGYDTIQFKLAA